MDLIDFINNEEGVDGADRAKQLAENASRLANDLSLINQKDDWGNTPLHYAVARQDLDLIKLLIERGADVTHGNCKGETAAEWFKLFLSSIYNTELDNFQALRQAIKDNDKQFIAELLALKVSRDLRFLQAKTLLHWAVDYQKIEIINVLLEGLEPVEVNRLLDLQDSKGVTPLALARQRCQPGSPGAQEIVSYLQKKQGAVTEGGSALALQTPLSSFCLLEEIKLELSEIQALLGYDPSHCFEWPDIVERLNPLRTPMVKLAYNICCQALLCTNNSSTVTVQQYNGKGIGSISTLPVLFNQLFGSGAWVSGNLLRFQEKLYCVVRYLQELIQQEKADQIIEFSEEKLSCGGWTHPGLDKIFLNPRVRKNLFALVSTLIHEVTHQTGQSYDFFSACYLNTPNGFYIHLSSAFELAATGRASALTLEQKKLFEVRQLLERGCHPDWKQDLKNWMALHSAETLTIATLALSALSREYAVIDRKTMPTSLMIDHKRFLVEVGLKGKESFKLPVVGRPLPLPLSSADSGITHMDWTPPSTPASPLPVTQGRFAVKKPPPLPSSSADRGMTHMEWTPPSTPTSPSPLTQGKFTVKRPQSLPSSSADSGMTHMEWTPPSTPASPLSVTQGMSAMQTSETAGGPPLSPEALQGPSSAATVMRMDSPGCKTS